MNILIEIRKRIEGALVAAVILLGVYWWTHVPSTPTPGYHLATPAPQIAKMPTVAIKPPKVMVYANQAKKKLGLPAHVLADQHTHIVAATRVPADTHPETVTTLIDDQTGMETTLVRQEPLPWLAAEQRGQLGLSYGMKNGGLKVGRLSFQEDLLQVKAFHSGVNATLDTDGQYFIGAGVAYRW